MCKQCGCENPWRGCGDKPIKSLKTFDVLQEVSDILSEKHTGYPIGSDRIRNATGFCHRIGRDFPEDALVLISDIRRNLDAASEVSELHPDRCAWVANRIEEAIHGQVR